MIKMLRFRLSVWGGGGLPFVAAVNTAVAVLGDDTPFFFNLQRVCTQPKKPCRFFLIFPPQGDNRHKCLCFFYDAKRAGRPAGGVAEHCVINMIDWFLPSICTFSFFFDDKNMIIP